MEIKKVGVIGAGVMGSGIVQVFAQAGYQVIMVDIKQEFIDKGMKNIKGSLERLLKKGAITQPDIDAIIKRIEPTTDLKALKTAQFAVEAATENFELKKQLFKDLDQICGPEVILSTNTSSISITTIAAVTKRPTQVIGMHFMNPVPVMKLVEVIRGLVTNDATFTTVKDLCIKLGKTPVEVNDAPGFVANRILMPMINEAVFTLQEGIATKEAIDEVMKLGMNHPIGPLALADLIGLDVCVAILDVLYQGFGDPKYRACVLLRKMVAAGHLGRKAGQGFYKYT